MLTRLLDHGVDPNIVLDPVRRTTPLMLAASLGQDEVVEALLEWDGELVHATDCEGRTAAWYVLHGATGSGGRTAAWHVQPRANVNEGEKRELHNTSSGDGVSSGDSSGLAAAWMAVGAAGAAAGVTAGTASGAAAEACSLQAAVAAPSPVAAGAASSPSSRSVLGGWESEERFQECVSDFFHGNVQAGTHARAHDADARGRTMLHLAASFACEESVAMLLAMGVGVTADREGNTPLSLAAYTNYPVVLRVLLRHGNVKPDSCGHSLQQLLDLAQEGLDSFVAAMHWADAQKPDPLCGWRDTVLRVYRYWHYLVTTELRRWFKTGGGEAQVRQGPGWGAGLRYDRYEGGWGV